MKDKKITIPRRLVNHGMLTTTTLICCISFSIHVFGTPAVEIRHAIAICPQYIFCFVTAADSTDPGITNCSLNITSRRLPTKNVYLLFFPYGNHFLLGYEGEVKAHERSPYVRIIPPLYSNTSSHEEVRPLR